jgi:VanZ family protein
MRRFVKYWMPAILWMVLIFVGSTDMLSAEHTSRFLVPFFRWLDPEISLAALAEIQFAVRKLGHFTEYAVLAMLLWRALRLGSAWTTRMSILFVITLLSCAVFAASDEFHQSLVPSRTASSIDVMIDVCGALLGLGICVLFARRKLGQVFASVAK